MNLTQALKISATHSYDRLSPLGVKQPIFASLNDFKIALEDAVPEGYRVKVSRGVGALPIGLWVAILNEEVTVTPTEGLYIVYLFDEGRQHVSLSLNQGVTKAGDRAKLLPISANQMLRNEASELRTLLPAQSTAGLSATVSLGAGNMLRAYEAGNVFAKTWTLTGLPEEAEFSATLDLFIDLYDAAVAAKENALTHTPGRFATPARGEREPARRPVFAPKSSEDYVVAAKSYVEPQRRQRKHEQLVKDFGEFAQARGLVPATNHHPIDLLLLNGTAEFIVEVKILNDRHPAGGVRESIGQLFEYRKFLRSQAPDTPLVAVYDWYPNEAFTDLLEMLGIAVCWRTPSGFAGTDRAADLGIVDRLVTPRQDRLETVTALEIAT
ncbi:hypothetical protein J2W14_002357 [Pseudarthrobacter oxydans]|uniref:MrcB family domain-containing protein n=1 Tax=Pseudarthrobacter oxydans TaxID=1671 RepID=UPI0027857FA3|nr:DUF3578 domain-containing protein [Pseudarthrobacter oxydans]MDP9982955.1 hypothetical protein [Pseudarthrobacter oxydans]